MAVKGRYDHSISRQDPAQPFKRLTTVSASHTPLATLKHQVAEVCRAMPREKCRTPNGVSAWTACEPESYGMEIFSFGLAGMQCGLMLSQRVNAGLSATPLRVSTEELAKFNAHAVSVYSSSCERRQRGTRWQILRSGAHFSSPPNLTSLATSPAKVCLASTGKRSWPIASTAPASILAAS